MVVECIGLPGSGKTYLFRCVEEELTRRGIPCVNASDRSMHSLPWKAAKKVLHRTIFLNREARRIRQKLRSALKEEGELHSRFGIYQNEDYTIRSVAVYALVYREMIRSPKLYLFDEGIVHALIKFCADFGISDDVFLKMASLTERSLHRPRIVVLNEISRGDCLVSIQKRNRHICEFDELESGRLSDILGEYERLNKAYKETFRVLSVYREEETKRSVSEILSGIEQNLL